MVNPFICGSGAFHHQEEEEDDDSFSPCSTPRKPRKSSNCRNKDAKNNPYSNGGLDKFSALLAELEDKRQKIYTQMSSDDISFVRFVYSNCDDIKPIVVRARDKKLEKNNSDSGKDKPMTHNPETLTSPNEVHQKGNELGDRKTMKKKQKIDLWRPYCYLPAVLILILVLLAVFDRSFAILCISLGWYLVPTINGGSSNIDKRLKKKKSARRVEGKKKIVSYGLSSPAGAMTGMSPRQHGDRKS